MRRPVAVLISDIHFSLNTLALASQSLLQAQFTAKRLNVTLAILGDLLNDKAILRGEVVNRLIQLFSVKDAPETIVFPGNHCKINEKSEEHSLNFLKPYCTVIENPCVGSIGNMEIAIVPYQHDLDRLQTLLNDEDFKSEYLFMHQGLRGALMGDYVLDRTAIPKEWLTGRKVISGHYHARQRHELPGNGWFQYLGNPYTMTFGEASDPAKGFQILYDDFSLEFVPTNLRKHVKFEVMVGDLDSDKAAFWEANYNSGDLLWVTVKGHREYLAKVTKEEVLTALELPASTDFKLDLVATDLRELVKKDSMSQAELLDSIISAGSSKEQAERLKNLWRTLS